MQSPVSTTVRAVALMLLLAAAAIAPEATAQPTPIRFGDTVQGTIEESDPSVIDDGAPADEYLFTAQSPGQRYVITAQSASLALQVLLVAEASGEPLQVGAVFAPGMQVQFSGTLAQSGAYRIILFDATGQSDGTGSYTLGLGAGGSGSAFGPSAGACGMGGGTDNPIALPLGQTLACQLLASDWPLVDDQGNTFYVKHFLLDSSGGPHTLAAISDAFTPELLLYNQADDNYTILGPDVVTVDLPPGPVIFGIDSVEPEGTGAFQITVQPAAPEGPAQAL